MNDTLKIYKPLIYGEIHYAELIAEGTHANLKYYIYSMGSYPCAYVDVTGTSYASMRYLDDNLICHGGITYSEGDLHDLDTKGHWYLGWDYAHFGDWHGDNKFNSNNKKWTIDEIALECCDVINQIVKPSLIWNVYRLDFNTRKITVFNIFKNSRFEKEVKELLEVSNIDKDAFSEQLNSILFYYYASRCEYEVGITSWPPCAIDKETNEPKIYEKVDIYQQVKLNWDAFIEYLWKRGKINENT